MTYRSQLLARLDALQAELATLAALVRLDAAQPAAAAPAPAPARATAPVAAAPSPVPAPTKPEARSPGRATAPVVVAAPVAPAKAPKSAKAGPAERKQRGRPKGAINKWSTAPDAAYRIVGDNPFKRGNNCALFAYLHFVYGSSVFNRADLGHAVEVLRAEGKFDATMDDRASIVAFVTLAGGKGRLAMASEVTPYSKPPISKPRPRAQVQVAAPQPAAPPKREAKVKRRNRPT